MSELLFALFILLGLLSGTLFAGNLSYLLFIKLPKLIKRKFDGDVVIPLEAFVDILLPVTLWTLVAASLIYLISNYFTIYQKLFYSGIAISIIFCLHTLISTYRRK